MWRHLGRTKEERDKKKLELKKAVKKHKAEVDARIAKEKEEGTQEARDEQEKRV